MIPCTSQNRISPVRRWVRRSKLTRTTLPFGRAPLEGAEHVRQTVIDWNSHTTTTFRGYGMFQFATMVGLPKTWVSVCVALAPTQAGMPSRGLAVPDGTNTSAQARSTRSSKVRLRMKQIVQGLTCRREVLNGLMSTITLSAPERFRRNGGCARRPPGVIAELNVTLGWWWRPMRGTDSGGGG